MSAEKMSIKIFVGFGDMAEEEVEPIDTAIRNQTTGKFRLRYMHMRYQMLGKGGPHSLI